MEPASEVGHGPRAGRDLPAGHELLELRRRCEAAEQASLARGSFLATISHEIREPMNGIVGMCRLLRDTPLDAEQRTYVDTAIESAEALLTLVNDVLDFSRIDAGRLELAPVVVDLAAFLQRFERQLMPRARDRQVAFSCRLAPDAPPLVEVDPGRLRQILVNLAGNALKFTDAGAVQVRVGARGPVDGGRVRLTIEVEDTGIGIAPAALADLFTSFGQADIGTPRLYGGSGLGLLIAQRLAVAMGGSVTVTSEFGRGTTFHVELVLGAVSTQPRSGNASASLAGASLLVADPQERTRSTTVEITRGWGLAVREARNGRQALGLLRDAADRGTPFDMALLDRGLEEPSATELARVVRAEPRLRSTALVLMVASGLRGDAAAARAQGFAAFLPRQVDPQTLLACLQTLRTQGATDGQKLITVHSLSEQGAPSLRLLLADDNPVNGRLASIILGRAGHAVDIVGDGEQALRALESAPYDMVLMDVQMPVMNGLEAARRIRRLPDPRLAGIPIVAITANAMRGDDETCFAAGMDGYVTKPISAATLLEAVQRHAPCTARYTES